MARWLTTNICRSGSLMALARAWCICMEEDGCGCCVSPARIVGGRGSFAFPLLKLTVVMGDDAAVAFVCEEDGGTGTF